MNRSEVLNYKPPTDPYIWERDQIASDYVKNLTRAFLYLTEKCNLECRGCYASAGPSRPEGSYTFMRDAVLSAKEWGAKSITFMGGEPTIWPHTLELARETVNQGLHVVIDSNGDKPAQKLLRDLVETIPDVTEKIRLNISIDSHRKDKHNAARGEKNNYQHLMETIKLAQELGFTISTCTTLTSETVDEVFDTLYWLEGLGVRESNVHLLSYEGRAMNYPELLVPARQWLNTVNRLVAHGPFESLNLRFPVVFGPIKPDDLKNTVLANKDEDWVYRCIGEGNSDRLGIRPSGSTHVCALVGFAGLASFQVLKQGKLVTLNKNDCRKEWGLLPQHELELYNFHAEHPTLGCPATVSTGEVSKYGDPSFVHLCRSVKIIIPSRKSGKDYFVKQYPANPNLSKI